MKLQGKVHKYGNHVDTDVIIPARYLNISDVDELKKYTMIDIDPDFTSKIAPNDIIVAGANFGCGSSREHAPLVIKESNISCVIAESFARIFYRNAINIGLPVLECPEAAKAIEQGNLVEVDLDNGIIKNIDTGETYQAVPFPSFMQNLIKVGGLINYTKSK